MSPRTFARIYAARMGITPARMVERIRVEAVRRILEETDMPIKRVASTCGFGQEDRLRRAFARRHNLDLAAAEREVKRRMAAQLPEEEKVRVADYVIDNSGALDELEAKVDAVMAELRKQKRTQDAGSRTQEG